MILRDAQQHIDAPMEELHYAHKHHDIEKPVQNAT